MLMAARQWPAHDAFYALLFSCNRIQPVVCFFRSPYFLSQNDPYKSLKTSLKAIIDADAWESLNSDTSDPFAKPSTGRIAFKLINHLGNDEVMKVYLLAS